MARAQQSLKFYQGWVQHTRTEPKHHEFRYAYFQIWLDVEQPQLIDNISRFWSSKKFNLVRFKRDNYLPDTKSIKDRVTELIEQKTGKHFTGKVYLLSSLSYWGYSYSPVSFYFCYDENHTLMYILSEIHNTPWGERFTYVHDVAHSLSTDNTSLATNKPGDKLSFEFQKQFHVSPFMPMEIEYDWHFRIKDEKILISMNLQQNAKSIFNATLNLTGQTLSKPLANSVPLRYSLMCFKVLTAIYWNALVLWIKRIPFHSHPERN